MNYDETSRNILANIGGKDNIKNITHCATRLRLNLYDFDHIDLDAIKKDKTIVGAVVQSDQLQLIIGTHVRDVYNDFIEISRWNEKENPETSKATSSPNHEKRKVNYYVNKVGNFFASVFMPIMPVLIVGGLILVVRNLLINYFGVEVEGGTSEVFMAIFRAAFNFFPVYIGYSVATTLKLQPVMGALLGALLVSPSISGVEGLSFMGISIPTAKYESSVFPIILGVSFMYFVNKFVQKIIPDLLKYVLQPIVVMLITVPITLIFLGPIGTLLSGTFTSGVLWLMEHFRILAVPLLAMVYPYMVMLGLDKAMTPLGIELIASIGYNPLTIVAGFISNISIGATALAVGMSYKSNAKDKGMIISSAVTALCGITEPAFYGTLIMRPTILIGTAIGAGVSGLIAGTFGLVNYVHGGAPGLLTFLYFMNPDGTLYNFILSFIVAATAIIVSYVSTRIIITRSNLRIESEQ